MTGQASMGVFAYIKINKQFHAQSRNVVNLPPVKKPCHQTFLIFINKIWGGLRIGFSKVCSCE